ncbi:MAG: CCA tRNA nucleotidyltransferase [Ruminococcus sp.]|nr:CCA tRNA nucleotidyltransferase [Ruminococcus sp.]
MISVPDYVVKAIGILEAAGFEAYCVGGCVRDSLLGREPNDWDVCTSATPDEMKEVFADFRTLDVGAKHGTVTVIVDRNPLEITTYRTDGEYSSHRRPISVSFIRDLSGDLSRRDFTINAICCDKKGAVTDMFGGTEDIENMLIRCVGDPCDRFEEDALRIMRALRFSSVLGFDIEDSTAEAIFKKMHLLEYVSVERIFSELKKLLCGKDATNVLLKFKDVFASIMPEITPCFGFDQHNVHHCYDVWEHIARSVGCSRQDERIRLAMLFHDIGKPAMARFDEDGSGHFKGHQIKSAEMLTEILDRFRSDNATLRYVRELVIEHDNRIPVARKNIKRFMAKHDFDFFMDYLEVRRADTMAQSDYMKEEKLSELEQLALIAVEVNNQNCCLKLTDLAVDGKDMISLGMSGRQIGAMLQKLLDLVVDDKLENDRTVLLEYAKERFR